ncbi:hypothetical protein COCNU_04G001870 [Cocos nucifera]|uniref:RING-type E3 ubiquitin transferase n=1 Tax=Cocos nucifera TaxID=13894 RepID=A0A8K0MZQ6_COCNU|nr:hypothetical protein COCNU_04G001870 [Cocos nucifera]
MGQAPSCGRTSHDHNFFKAVEAGDLAMVESSLRMDPEILHQTTLYDRLSPLHIAAANGRLEILSRILDRSVHPDLLNRHKQVFFLCDPNPMRIPYIVALKRKHRACAALLNPSSAEPLVWPSPLKFMGELKPDAKALLEAALMDANREREKNILKGTTYSLPSPVHSEGEIDNDNASEATDMELCCICFDQICTIEVQDCGHQMCAHCTLAVCCHSKPNPSTLCLSAPLCPFCRSSIARLVVAKTKIKEEGDKDSFSKQAALMDANREREKNILKGTTYSLPSPVHSEGEIDNDNASEATDMELCCICFDQICTIEVQDCGHQMCAHCTLAVCCHSKPNPSTLCLSAPLCPFCRSSIARLVVAKTKIKEEGDKDSFSKPCKLRKSQNSSSEGSSSFKGLSSAVGSLGKMGSRGSGKIADGCDMMEKP